MLVLAFDTATDVATVALTRGNELLGERLSSAGRLLREVDELLRLAEATPDQIEAIAVGTGPGRYTSLRMGLISARALSFSIGAPVAGVSTLAALAAGAEGALPVIDARRREVFSLEGGEPRCLRPADLPAAGRTCVGDGAVLYREILEGRGAVVPPDDDPRHVPWARYHARLAVSFGDAALVEPVYLRTPDADRALSRARENR